MRTITRRVTTVLTALLLSAAVISTVALPAQSSVSSAGRGELVAIRMWAHPTYDRIVLDFPGGAPDVVRSRFVPELIRDGSGEVEHLPGAVFAEVTMTPAGTADDHGRPTYLGPRKLTVPGMNNLTAFAITGDFEGYLTLGMGMQRQTSLHVFTLTGPPRIVIDIAR